MAGKVRTYNGENIDVTYDVVRCIHAEECIKHSPAVFDKNRRPWITADSEPADQLVVTVERCPSGALHYERKDGGDAEAIPDHNTIRLSHDGPLYLRGDFTILNGMGELVANDTRAALCRCGGSANKPFCDNTHRSNGFQASGTLPNPRTPQASTEGGKLTIETTTNGPLHITGSFSLLSEAGEVVYQGTDEWFCRCGGSANKPFCDSTHRKIGFVAE